MCRRHQSRLRVPGNNRIPMRISRLQLVLIHKWQQCSILFLQIDCNVKYSSMNKIRTNEIDYIYFVYKVGLDKFLHFWVQNSCRPTYTKNYSNIVTLSGENFGILLLKNVFYIYVIFFYALYFITSHY